MPKMKTKRAAAKRFKLTKTGKVKFKKAFKRHILESKSPKMKAHARPAAYLKKCDEKHAKECLPYA